MAPAATVVHNKTRNTDKCSKLTQRGWDEARSEIPSILIGRGQENASTMRHNLEESMDSQRKSSDRIRSRGRQNSLKRTKNSTDLLRQRSQKRDGKEPATDANASTREGRQFTVANVGNNGKIYLRPTTRTPQKPPTAYPLSPSSNVNDDEDDNQYSRGKKRWSDTQASRTPTRNPRENSVGRNGQRSSSIQRRSVDSISTINGGQSLDHGQFKVVINQKASGGIHPGEQLLPSLEVPIPHYRLGTPRFSTQGTAILHSQIYSRASTADDAASVISGQELEAMFPVPPGMETHTTSSRSQGLNSQPQPVVQMSPAAARIPISKSPANNRAKLPIVPAIYDAIAKNPDDPAIVRYAMSTREISAASPARLIAQITSKNFLDYELLSDFFLTVRAYMSTHDLLAYLLTRFEWAINRFDDDGRVIRVRAFAAIRHWILNYFPYDFVVDRELRVKFCQYLNMLAHQVRKGPPHDPSDLKLIIDLKKCWNGRCVVYWDNPISEVDGRTDPDISPGGIVGSRDSKLTHPSELWAKIAESSSQQVDQAKSVAALHNWVDSVIEAEVEGKGKTDRGVSLGTSRSMALSSPLSDLSVPAMSCSIPGKTLKTLATSHRNPGPHPMPTTVPPTVRRIGPAAPSAVANENKLHAKQDHKRSGSFQDALGDRRTSLPSMQLEQNAQPVVMSFPFSGSLIRGCVLPPGSPFIDNLTAHDSCSSLPRHGQYVEGPMAVRPMSPGVKNLLGTIRRAIGSKQNSNVPTPTMLSTAPFMVETKNSTLPMHIAYKIEGLGDQHRQLEALKKNARIDLLCADITDMFERAVVQEPPPMTAPPSSFGQAVGNEQEEPWNDNQRLMSTPEREALHRTHSEMTTGSKSIVIMDDTAYNPPVPNLPPQFERQPHMAPTQSTDSTQLPYSMAGYSTAPPPVQVEPSAPVRSMGPEGSSEEQGSQSTLLPPFTIPIPSESGQTQQNLGANTENHRTAPPRQARPSFTTGRSFTSYRSSRSGPGSLRKYQSYQSGMRGSGAGHEFGAAARPDSPPMSSKGQYQKPAGRMLRRRPGGDLRANENVHDMEPIPRPKSTGSINTYAESLHNSSVYLKRITTKNAPNQRSSEISQFAPTKAPPTTVEKPVSLVSTRASQPELRRSFEAAVAEFARIPDDDGGDLEATLAKLEGKFRKSPLGTPEGDPPFKSPIPNGVGSAQGAQDAKTSKHQVREQRQKGPNNAAQAYGPSGASEKVKGETKTDRPETMARSLYAESEESYNSTPLVERSHSNKGRKAQASSDQSGATVPRPLFSPNKAKFDNRTEDIPDDSSQITADDQQSYKSNDVEGNVRRGRCRSSLRTCTTDSFLLDEDEFLSDTSSEFSDDIDGSTGALDEALQASARQYQNSMLPPNVTFAQGYLPSPPMTTENAIAINSENSRMQEQRKPPTPEPSPVSRLTDPGKSRTPNEVDGSVLQPFANKVHQFPTRRHIPFVLAFDAAVLAQQFTIIERDALNEINWQDLIDMRWQTSKTETQNWVEYLRYQEPTGIELVTARFNIVVKWTLSEIMLTQNIEERALTIMKYIQVAQIARKCHNYATLLQVTIALTSIDCQRLTKTWDLVPAAEKTSLKEMEVLVSPLRNFHNLRSDMETANLEDGCIPVVALYIHDLTYNAQKPSVIASTRDGEPLINFERYRTAATIVKSLLRLIDASAKYDFKIVEGALERCLWMASLSDDMIRTKSKELEV
ncbi:Guanine nucleotide exchange factor lte1 [Lecanora helva]